MGGSLTSSCRVRKDFAGRVGKSRDKVTSWSNKEGEKGSFLKAPILPCQDEEAISKLGRRSLVLSFVPFLRIRSTLTFSLRRERVIGGATEAKLPSLEVFCFGGCCFLRLIDSSKA
jgi:hypothetical protein